MLGGGIADKLGNEYELRWTLVEVLRVLRGLTDELRLEPYNENALGLEFRITANGVDEWHQCKRRRSSGSWSIKNLTDEGVLQAFANKLSYNETKCVFISSDPAPALETLIEKANLAETANDFYGGGGIGKSDRVALKELYSAWPVEPEQLFGWLKRCRVEVTSDASLRRRLEELCQLIFRTPHDQAIDRLSRFLTSSLGRRLTTDNLKTTVADLGIEWLAHLDETLDAKFSSATDEYIASLSPKIAGIELPLPDLDQIVRTAIADEKPITIVAGGAGSGKSVVLSQIIAQAREQSWPVLAFRIDRYLETQSLEDLGRELLGHEGSPVASFGGRHAVSPTLLVIDQIDAVSEASGRSGRMRELLFRMIQQSDHFPLMRVVAACRSYDLDRDTRLGQLSQNLRVTSLKLKPLDWKEAVQPLLTQFRIDDRSLTERSRQVLSVPINLQLFVTIAEAGERAEGELSSSRLFDKLMEVRERALRQAGYTWTALEVMKAIAQYMSENQELTAPQAVIDRFSGAVDALNSSGLVTAIGRKLQFAHESFFDHTFSRHFITSGQTVYSLLISDEQRLFRRTQVRQILSRLRDNGGRSYFTNLREILTASDVRYLVKDAVAYWLSEVENPTTKEFNLIEGWLSTGHPQEKLAKIVFNGIGWLPILLDSGTIERLFQEGGETKEFAFWLLNKGATCHSDLVSNHLRQWWQANPEARCSELIAWFARLSPDAPIGSLETLYAEAISAIPVAALKEDFEDNFELGLWVHKSKPLGARVLGFWLRAWMTAFPNRHPFDSFRGNGHSYWINELAEHEPGALLQAIVPAFAEALKREQSAFASGTLPFLKIHPPNGDHDQEYLSSIIKSLESHSVFNANETEKFLDILGVETDVAIFARLRAIAACKGLHHLLVPLLAQQRVFKIGYSEGDWLPFANAAAAAMPHLEAADRLRIEEAIMAYRPEYDWARKYYQLFKSDELIFKSENPYQDILYQLRMVGRTERAILKTIGPDVLSEVARRRLAELDRKFLGKPLPKGSGIRGGWVSSPIAPDKARFMSDRQWMQAIRKYDGDRLRFFESDSLRGGSRELAATLQARVKEEPERFVAFLEKLPIDTKSEYVEAVIYGLRECETDGVWVARALKAALRRPDFDFGRAANWTIQTHPAAALDPDVLAYLLRSAEHGSASDTAVTTTNRNKMERKRAVELLQGDDDLSMSGINGERGAGYEALASVLWDHEETLAEILTLLERRVQAEPLASVRICMARTINSVGKYKPDEAAQLFRRLVVGDQRVLLGHASLHMLNWVVYRNPEIVAEFASNLVSSDRTSLRALGHHLESLLALLDEKQNLLFVAGFLDSSLRRVMASHRASGNISSEKFGDRAASWLIEFFNDDDPAVRAETANIRWGDILDDDRHHSEFIKTYIASSAFYDNSDHIIHAIEDRVSQFPDLAFAVVDRILANSGDWIGENRSGHYFTFHHLSRVLVELYRVSEGGSANERRILDLFDAYLSRDIYDMRNEISAYERH